MARTTLLLADDLLLEVKRLAREQGKTSTQIVREALDAYIAQQQRPQLPSFTGVGRSGRRSVSEKAEEILKRQANQREVRACRAR